MTMRTKPPFRADHVGSLLRPAALKKAREQCAKGEIDAAALKAVEDREIERVIKRQEDVGLQSITDGEFRRSWWHLDFLWGLDGIEKHVMDTGIAFAAVTTRNEGLKVTGKVGFSGHPMIEHFKFVAAHTQRTPKITIPSPSAAYGRPVPTPIDRKIYPKLDAFFDDLGQAYKKAVRAFADAGCRYLQLDEVFIAMLCDQKYRAQMKARGDDPEKLGELYGDLINTAMSDIPADMTITMHLCRGNYKSTFMGSGGYEAEQEILFNRIKVHGYFMEYDSARAGGFEPLKLVPKDRQVVLGLVTTKTGRLEQKGRPQAAHRRSHEIYFARSALPVAAMRLCLDRRRQRLGRGRAMGQAQDDRRGRRGDLELAQLLVEKVSNTHWLVGANRSERPVPAGQRSDADVLDESGLQRRIKIAHRPFIEIDDTARLQRSDVVDPDNSLFVAALYQRESRLVAFAGANPAELLPQIDSDRCGPALGIIPLAGRGFLVA